VRASFFQRSQTSFHCIHFSLQHFRPHFHSPDLAGGRLPSPAAMPSTPANEPEETTPPGARQRPPPSRGLEDGTAKTPAKPEATEPAPTTPPASTSPTECTTEQKAPGLSSRKPSVSAPVIRRRLATNQPSPAADVKPEIPRKSGGGASHFLGDFVFSLSSTVLWRRGSGRGGSPSATWFAPLSLSLSPLRGARGRHPTISEQFVKK
jgi:hypothetical protein